MINAWRVTQRAKTGDIFTDFVGDDAFQRARKFYDDLVYRGYAVQLEKYYGEFSTALPKAPEKEKSDYRSGFVDALDFSYQTALASMRFFSENPGAVDGAADIASKIKCMIDKYDDGPWGVAKDENARMALRIACKYGGVDGDHHKAWVIDQMCRYLLGESYDEFVRKAREGIDGPETFNWNVGTPP